jgi:hypothetical protein
LTSMSRCSACPSMTPCAKSPAHNNPTAGVITLRCQFGQKPVQRQNPGLTMPVCQDPGAAVTYDANVVRNPLVT